MGASAYTSLGKAGRSGTGGADSFFGKGSLNEYAGEGVGSVEAILSVTGGGLMGASTGLKLPLDRLEPGLGGGPWGEGGREGKGG